MLTYATSFNIGKLIVMTWCFPGMERYFVEDNNCQHLFGKLYWKNE